MVEDFLKDRGIDYELLEHGRAFSAQETAAVDQVSGYEFAKTVIATDGDEYYMLVVPAVSEVQMEKAGGLVRTDLALAQERELADLFPDCEVGAEPPFGSQYGLQTFVDGSLAEKEYITFRAGTHDRSIRMKCSDYMELEKPVKGFFAAPRRVEQFLSARGERYREIRHPRAYTAQEVAEAEGVTGYKFAKTVILTDGERYYMVVLPAPYEVDLERAGELIGAEVRLADEAEMAHLFPESELGAEPPFGSMYGIPTFMDRALRNHRKIIFRAQTHDKSIEMRLKHYERVENPTAGDLRAPRRVESLLNRRGVSYDLRHHREPLAAEELGVTEEGISYVKSALVTDGTEYALLVLLADSDPDLDRASQLVSRDVRLASDDEVSARCPGCQRGAIPPFGSLFGITTYADSALRGEDQVAFLAETCDRSIVMSTADLLEVEKPAESELTSGA